MAMAWPWMIDTYPYCSMSIGPPISEIRLFQNLTMKSHGQDHACGQRSSSLCWLSNQSIFFSFHIKRPCYSRNSAIKNLPLKIQAQGYDLLLIWPWKFKVKTMAQVNPIHHIWSNEFNWYVCFSFCGQRTSLYLTLKIQDQDRGQNSVSNHKRNLSPSSMTQFTGATKSPFYQDDLFEIRLGISNYIRRCVWYVIFHPCSNCKDRER